MDRDSILRHLARGDYEPCKARALARRLEVSDRDFRAFRGLLRALEEEGPLVRLKGGRWALAETAGRITGVIEIKRGGFGFLLPDDPHLDDVFLPERELGDAMTGDRVAVRLRRETGRRGHRRFGAVEKILERSTKRLVGVLALRGPSVVCLPEDDRLPAAFRLAGRDGLPSPGAAPAANPGDKVLLEIDEWPRAGLEGSGHVLERLGPAGEPGTETAAILANWNAPGPFPEEAL
ncbi:MAG: hypothetical protein V1918_06000, partial [Planctomycetota bacterium]